MNAGDFFDFSGTSPFSLETWVSPEIVDTKYRHIFIKYDQTQTGGREEYGVFVQSSEALVVERWVAGSDVKAHAPILPLNHYTYVVATYDSTTLILYVNGTKLDAAADARSQRPKPVPELVGLPGAEY